MRQDWPGIMRSAGWGAILVVARLWRNLWLCVGIAVCAVIAAAAFIVVANTLFHSQRDVPYRALDPRTASCTEGAQEGWDVLDRPVAADYVPNDEWAAVDTIGAVWKAKLSCAIQRHVLKGATAAGRPLAYDLAFIEFQEDGKPYALREPCVAGDSVSEKGCVDEGYGLVRKGSDSQLGVLLDRLREPVPHYVLVFIHGWRHDASIGDENVGDLRHYAAHAARFVADRAATNPGGPSPRVTAVYIGWRGARTDENWLTRKWGSSGSLIGTVSAAATLFDRKPVSEAVAPSVLAGLRAIEQTIGIADPLPLESQTPRPTASRMIVFGHSLGGNLLATALQDDLVKKVALHQPKQTMLPALGDLVVLINPASEATKWTAVQRAVWRRMATSASERRPIDDYSASHNFFRVDQRPIVVSVTAARDWPPGGRRELDCAPLSAEARTRVEESRALVQAPLYDWATYDLFPFFKLDARPVADTIARVATRRDPHDACDTTQLSTTHAILSAPLVGISELLRVLPFQQTDPEQTRTIGNLDPPRAPRGRLRNDYVSARPFGTTHELRGPALLPSFRKQSDGTDGLPRREIPIDYDEITGSGASCPAAAGWLSKAREAKVRADPASHGTFWNSDGAAENRPALQFVHGFTNAGIAPITRANDPFWNMRAFDTALARHDGYMLSSFICAMNQLVLDEITAYPAPATGAEAPAAPPPATAE